MLADTTGEGLKRLEPTMATTTQWVNGTAETAFLFGAFRLMPRQRLLLEAGKPVHLGSRAFDILVALLERPGELVSKNDLMARVWPNTFVAPANLAVHISALRRVFGDGRGGNRYVVNIPGRGYRFVAPVRVVEDVPARPPARTGTIGRFTQQLPAEYSLVIVGPGVIDRSTIKLTLMPHLGGTHHNGGWFVHSSWS